MFASRAAIVLCLSVSGTAALAGDATRDEAIRSAKEALGRELSIDPRRIAVAKVDAAEWRDGSLGCPQAGMSYTQALVSGYSVLLRVASASYQVNVAGERAVLCDSTRSRSKNVDTGGAAASVHVARLARRALAARLGLPTGEVSVESVRPIRWPDANLGCPGAGPGGEPVAGFVIELSHGTERHTYHADYERVVYCEPISGGG